MGLSNCELYINSAGRELKTHGTEEFPCAAYVDDLVGGKEIAWHWHNELEVIYVKQGTVAVRLPGKRYNLEAGDLFVVNSNILHYVKGDANCLIQSFVFGKELFGSPAGVVLTKYIEPLVKCAAFEGITYREESLADAFLKGFTEMERDAEGYELSVVMGLLQILHKTVLQYEADILTQSEDKRGSTRIQTMLHYMHEHYQEKLSVEDIGQQVNIGRRECLRCFQKNIQMSPLQYLIRFRVSKAAELLKNTELSIAEIALHSGFDSPSNFTMQFKRYYLMTPRVYRETVSGTVVQ